MPPSMVAEIGLLKAVGAPHQYFITRSAGGPADASHALIIAYRSFSRPEYDGGGWCCAVGIDDGACGVAPVGWRHGWLSCQSATTVHAAAASQHHIQWAEGQIDIRAKRHLVNLSRRRSNMKSLKLKNSMKLTLVTSWTVSVTCWVSVVITHR